MKTISLTQPYATLIALGKKRIETRSWSTSFRGPLAIHAAKGPGELGSFKAIRDLCGTQPFFDALYPIVPGHDRYCDRDAIFECLPSGAIVAVCELVSVIPVESVPREGDRDTLQGWTLTDQERAFGDYSPSRYAWLLANVRALAEPIPARGQLGLWEWNGEV